MYDVIQNLHSELFPNEELPSSLNRYDLLHRRTLDIKKVVTRIMEEFHCSNVPPDGLQICRYRHFGNASAEPIFEGSQVIAWRLRLPRKWWIKSEEVRCTETGQVVLAEPIATRLRCKEPLDQETSEELLSDIANPQQAADTVYRTLGHELGHLEHGHVHAHGDGDFRGIESVLGLATVGVFVIGSAATTALFLGNYLSARAMLNFQLALTGVSGTSLAFISYALLKRHEREADLFATRSPRAIQGGIWGFQRNYDFERRTLGRKWYWAELVDLLKSRHPTFRQRVAFFSQAATSMNKGT
jgi:hypothetical protein